MKFLVDIYETYKYQIKVDAENPKEALRKAQQYYADTEDGIIGVACANSWIDTKFDVVYGE